VNGLVPLLGRQPLLVPSLDADRGNQTRDAEVALQEDDSTAVEVASDAAQPSGLQ
jgi:hypothetical protein